MRLSSWFKLVLVGAAGAYVYNRVRPGTVQRTSRRSARGTVPPPDPLDPVQAFYAENDDMIERDESLDTTELSGRRDTGDLYGVHMVAAEDPHHADNDVAMEDGNNWLEALAADSVEGGPLPEQEVDIDEDDEIALSGHKTDTSDTPVADRGAGGPGGL
ncbi:MAG TPA: hypothetical protein VGM39_26125 [Kofleriaceae bacterium]|jgi:hypothetical protein